MLCQTVPQDSRTKKLKLDLSLIAKSKIRFEFDKKIYKRKVIDLSLIVHYNVEYLSGNQNPKFLTFKSDNKSLLWARRSPIYIDLWQNLKADTKSKDGWYSQNTKSIVKIQKVEQFKQNPEGYTVHFDCLL